MLGAVPIGTWLTLLVYIPPSTLGREVILRKEDGITSKCSHQSTIPLLRLSQLLHQIYEFFALDINLDLLEAREICRKFSLLVMMFTISTRDTVPRS